MHKPITGEMKDGKKRSIELVLTMFSMKLRTNLTYNQIVKFPIDYYRKQRLESYHISRKSGMREMQRKMREIEKKLSRSSVQFPSYT